MTRQIINCLSGKSIVNKCIVVSILVEELVSNFVISSTYAPSLTNFYKKKIVLKPVIVMLSHFKFTLQNYTIENKVR